jgi:hypothetical protein
VFFFAHLPRFCLTEWRYLVDYLTFWNIGPLPALARAIYQFFSPNYLQLFESAYHLKTRETE